MRVAGSILVALLVAMAAGCRTVRVSDSAAAAPAALAEPGFPAAASILSGLDIDPDAGPWRIGDSTLLGITVARAGEQSTLYMLTELVAPSAGTPNYVMETTTARGVVTYSSPMCRTRIRLFDASGTQIQESDGAIPTMILNCGPYETAAANIERVGRGGAAEMDPGLEDRACIGFITFLAFGESSGKNRLLADLISRVVRRPPLLSLLTNRTIAISIAETIPVRLPDRPLTGGGALPVSSVPLRVEIAGSSAVGAALTLAPSCPPIGLVGGILAADIRHPSEPGTWAQVRLLAARRGDGAAWTPAYATVTRVAKRGTE